MMSIINEITKGEQIETFLLISPVRVCLTIDQINENHHRASSYHSSLKSTELENVTKNI